MFVVKKSNHNPLIIPTEENLWESVATFNCCPIKEYPKRKNSPIIALYRAMGTRELVGSAAGPEHLSTIGIANSTDGIIFKNRRQLFKPEFDWEKYGCEDPRVTFFEGTYYIFYTALGNFPFSGDGIKAAVALSKDLKKISAKHLSDLADGIVDNKITRNSGKQALQEMVKTGKSLSEIITALDLGHASDASSIEKIVDEVFKEEEKAVLEAKQNPDAVNYIVGKVMRKTKGKVDPSTTLEIIRKKLSS